MSPCLWLVPSLRGGSGLGGEEGQTNLDAADGLKVLLDFEAQPAGELLRLRPISTTTTNNHDSADGFHITPKAERKTLREN